MMSAFRPSGYVDPGWAHGVAQDKRKKKVGCNYCGKVVSGGIYRLKQHLAWVSGEVTHCERVPEDVRLKMRENLEGCRAGKRSRKHEHDEQSYLNFNASDDAEEEEDYELGKNSKQLLTDNNVTAIMSPLRSLGYVDPGWEHGVPQDARKKKVKCNYCEKIVSGGINRFKQHLARIPGEVSSCKNAPEDVYLRMKENMKWHRSGRKFRRTGTKEISSPYLNSENEAEENEVEASFPVSNDLLLHGDRRYDRNLKKTFNGLSACSGSEIHPKWPRIDSNVPETPKTHMSLSGKHMKSRSSKCTRKEVISAICKFFHHAGIPFHAANSSYFHKMLELVGRYGSDLSGPSGHSLSGRLLQDEVLTIRNYLEAYKSSWAVTGCSILADSWKDIQGRLLINILVSCPCGVYFVSSVDATGLVDDASYLYKLLDKVVEEMGEENVVQVITPNTPSYKAAGKLLEERRRSIFWTPCATYCIDKLLEDFMKLNLVRDCIDKGQKITKFIYNRAWLLNLMKKEFTGGEDLLKPSVTRSASSFSTLQRLLDHRSGLGQMFQSSKLISSQYSRLDEGKEVKNIILDSSFWKKVQFIRRSVDPILEILEKINCDESISIPFIYNDMHRAKMAIKTNHNDDPRKYEPFWSIFDNHWDSLFHHPLHLAAYFLNPSYRYRADFILNPDVVRGLNACIVRLESENAKRISASMQISEFGSAKADFGTDLAISTRLELDPAAWWQQHGINCLELQRVAVRILSQSCSSFGCEHNWSIHDQIYAQRHNRVTQKKLNEAIYVHYNLRLRERQMRKTPSTLVSFDGFLHEDVLYDWIAETEKQALPEDEKFEEESAGSRKGSLEVVLTDVSEPQDADYTAQDDVGSEDSQDLDFIDDDFSK